MIQHSCRREFYSEDEGVREHIEWRGLVYAAIAVNDVPLAANVLERELGFYRREVRLGPETFPLLSVGESAVVLFPVGHPFVEEVDTARVHHLALETRAPEAAVKALAEAGVPVAREPTPGLEGTRRWRIDHEATCGVRLCINDPLDYAQGSPRFVEHIDHFGVANTDNEAALDIFRDRMGFPLESYERVVESTIAVETLTSNKYGDMQISRPPVIVGGLRAEMFTIGDCELEVFEELGPQYNPDVHHGQPGSTAQDGGVIARFLRRNGPGLHHMALKVTDIAAAIDSLQTAGVRMIDPSGRPGARHAMIAFPHPSSLGGMLIHFVERQTL